MTTEIENVDTEYEGLLQMILIICPTIKNNTICVYYVRLYLYIEYVCKMRDIYIPWFVINVILIMSS